MDSPALDRVLRRPVGSCKEGGALCYLLVEECVRIASMAAAKPKPDSSKVRWANQVVKTADGRLIVRGVDVPVSGWKSVTSGKTPSTAKSVSARASFSIPTPITTKREALATAKRAGLAAQVLSTRPKKANSSENGGPKTSMASVVLTGSSGGKKAAASASAKRGTTAVLASAVLSNHKKK